MRPSPMNRYKDALRECHERLAKEREPNEEQVNKALHEALARAALEHLSTELELKVAFTKAAEDERSGGDDGGGGEIARASRRSERGQERHGRKSDSERKQ